jgi:DNA-binding HxlR family transcriptional regulator
VGRSAIARSLDTAPAKGRPSKIAKQGGAPQDTVESTLPNLDRIIHEHMRLGIVSALAVNDSLTFNELKKLLQTSDGNLSVHARRLEEAEYITCTKSFEGRMPKSEYSLTNAGRTAFDRYLNHMEALIQAARER